MSEIKQAHAGPFVLPTFCNQSRPLFSGKLKILVCPGPDFLVSLSLYIHMHMVTPPQGLPSSTGIYKYVYVYMYIFQENTNFPVVCVSGPGEIEYATQFFWMDRPPYEGQFTYNSDRDMVLNVIRKAPRLEEKSKNHGNRR